MTLVVIDKKNSRQGNGLSEVVDVAYLLQDQRSRRLYYQVVF